MPYYNWVGIDLLGNTQKGITQVPSFELLEQYLFQHEIGLLKAHIVEHKAARRWKNADTLELFEQLIMLLSSGVFLTDALQMLIKLSQKKYVAEVLNQILHVIHDGGSLYQALQDLEDYFDPLTITMIKAGEESGNLVLALQSVCNHISSRELFKKRLKSAALTPAITFMFFIAVVFIIMIFVIPRFEFLFIGHEQEIPLLTRYIMRISTLISSISLYMALGLIGCLGSLIYYCIDSVRSAFDRIVLKIPFLKNIVIQSSLISLLEPLSLLLQTGVPLLSALQIAQESVSNSVINASFRSHMQSIVKGDSLSQSMQETVQFIPLDLIAMVHIGEESGKLSVMLGRCSRYYQEQVIRALDKVALLFQPILMIILGLLVALLIFAVYMPLFQLSNIVSY